MSAEHAPREVLWIVLGRAMFGLPALVAPEAACRLLGWPARSGDRPTRMMAGFFGVREVALPAVLLWARRDRAQLRHLLLLATAFDLGDAVVAGRELIRGRGFDGGAAVLLASALVGSGVAWSVASRIPREVWDGGLAP